ncbi:MAG: ABC transporter permease [Clostridiales bacterium]|jgi:spermidine/putrescine transport system permease protein|nr:ABC transporter permease [Clostridiales bacterium]
MKKLSKIYNALIFIFLYAPILVLIVFSFNDSKSRVVWQGFTTRWYGELFQDKVIMESLLTTLEVAVLSALFATIIGTLAAVGIYSMNRKLRKTMLAVNNIPMVNPEIVTGVSLMLVFVFVFRATGMLQMGFGTLLLSHITFNIPYVVLQVMPKLRQMDRHMYEAALDLGCSPRRAFFRVVLPEILPGVVTGALMAFTLSLDDFVISLFTSGSTAQTLSVTIYAMTKKRVSPKINALSTLLFGAVLLLLIIVNLRQMRDMKKQKKHG